MRLRRVDIRSERGFIIPAALMVLTVILLLVAAVVVEATATNNQVNSSLNAIRAQEAADAGLSAAIYDYDALNIDSAALMTGEGLASNISSKSGNYWVSHMQNGGGPELVQSGCYSSSGTNGVVLAGGTTTNPSWCNPVTDTLAGSEAGGAPIKYSYTISPPYQSIDNVFGSSISAGSGVDCIMTGDTCATGLFENFLSLVFCSILTFAGCITGGPYDQQFTAEDYRTIVATGIAGSTTRTVEETVEQTAYLLDSFYLECTSFGFLGFCLTNQYTPANTDKDPYGHYALALGSGSDGSGAGGFIMTQYYAPVSGSYRECSSAAYSLTQSSPGTAIPASDCNDY
jgi:type II secretory pathway pseudopilin PulG